MISQIIYKETSKKVPKQLLVTTTATPDKPLSFEQWLKQFNVGITYDRRVIHIDNIPNLKK